MVLFLLSVAIKVEIIVGTLPMDSLGIWEGAFKEKKCGYHSYIQDRGGEGMGQ